MFDKAESNILESSEAFTERTESNGRESSPLAEAPCALTPDPMVDILAAFYAIPSEYHADLFSDFRNAADSGDLRQLLDAISDWAATAELYADAPLMQEVLQAIEKRQGA